MISQYLGFDSDYIIIGLAALVLVLIILMIINVVQMSKLKKSYKIFMKGKNAKNLEDTLIKRLTFACDAVLIRLFRTSLTPSATFLQISDQEW